MNPGREILWQQQLESATRERNEIETKMWFDSCPWYLERELQDEWSYRLRLIDEAEIMLGLREGR